MKWIEKKDMVKMNSFQDIYIFFLIQINTINEIKVEIEFE